MSSSSKESLSFILSELSTQLKYIPPSPELIRAYEERVRRSLSENPAAAAIPEYFSCIPITCLFSIQSDEIFEHFLNILHPMKADPAFEVHDPHYLCTAPPLYTLLMQNRPTKAQMFLDRGAKLDFYHPLLNTTSLHMLLCRFKSEEDSVELRDVRTLLIENAIRCPEGLPWKKPGNMQSVSGYELFTPLSMLQRHFAAAEKLFPSLRMSQADLDRLEAEARPECYAPSIQASSPLELKQRIIKQLISEHHKISRSPEFKKHLAFYPEDLFIFLIQDRIVPLDLVLDDSGTVFLELILKEIFPLTRMLLERKLLTLDAFMEKLFCLPLPEIALAKAIPDPFTQFLHSWRLSQKQGTAHRFLPQIHYWGKQFFYQPLCSAMTGPCVFGNDSAGRTPLELATWIQSIDLNLYTNLAKYEARHPSPPKTTFTPSAFEIAIFTNDHFKILALLEAGKPSFCAPLFQALPFRGGSAYLQLYRRCLNLMQQKEKNQSHRDACTLAGQLTVYSLSENFSKTELQAPYFDPSDPKTLPIQSTYSILKTLIETHISIHLRINKHELAYCARFKEETPVKAFSSSKPGLGEQLKNLRANLAFLIENPLQAECSFADPETALETLNFPSLYFHFIQNSEHDDGFNESVMRIKATIEARRCHYFFSDEVDYEGATLHAFMDMLHEKNLRLNEAKIREQAEQELLDEEDAEKRTAEEKQKSKKTRKKFKKKGKPTLLKSAEPLTFTLEPSTETTKACGGAGRASPLSMLVHEDSNAEATEKLPAAAEPCRKSTKNRRPAVPLPSMLQAYQVHYEIVEQALLETLFSAKARALDDRLWIYGSALDQEKKSSSEDIDFILYLDKPLDTKTTEQLQLCFQAKLDERNPESDNRVQYHPEHQCWHLSSPGICIDVRLCIAPSDPADPSKHFPLKTLIEQDIEREILRHKAQRWNPRTSECRGVSESLFKFSRDLYEEPLTPALVAYVIKNFATSTRPLSTSAETTLFGMLFHLSLEANSHWYGIHFLALSLALYKYRQAHAEALLGFCHRYQLFPLLLGLGYAPVLDVRRVKDSPQNLFYEACLLYRGRYTSASISMIKNKPGLKEHAGIQTLLSAL